MNRQSPIGPTAPIAPTNQDTVIFVATNLTPTEAKFLGEIQALFCDPALAAHRDQVMKGQAMIWHDAEDKASRVVTLDYLQDYFVRRLIKEFNKPT